MPRRAARSRAMGNVLLGVAALCVAIAAPTAVWAQDEPPPGLPGSPLDSEPAPADDPTTPTPDEGGELPPAPADDAEPPVAPRGASPELVAQGAASVIMRDFDFVPASIAVDVGDTVTWTNQGPNEPHTATAEDGSFDTGQVAVGDSASHTFRQAGRFPYICTLHANMKGTVTVGDPSGGGPRDRDDDTGDTGSGDEGAPATGGSGPFGTAPTEADAATAPGAAGSSSHLPSTGGGELPLAIAGIGLLAAGALLRRAASF